jgi:hypothetical protein
MMATISKAAVKRAVIAAQKRRAAQPDVFRPEAAHYPRLQHSEREGGRLFTEFFRKGGFDARTYHRLKKQHTAELNRILDAEKAAAVKRASRARDTVHSSIAGQTRALQQLTAQKGFFPYPSYSLDKPFLIWAQPHANIISEDNIESFNSWAKIRVTSSADEGAENLSFYFLWDNPSDFYAVINASTFMSASGHLKAVATGGLSGIDPTSRFSGVGCSAKFALWSWWQNPPTHTDYAEQLLSSIQVSASFWDKSATANVSDGASLDRTMFLVPPGGAVIFEVVFAVGYYQGHGHCDADFESGSFRITCPVVVVSVLTGSPTLAVC